jgi:broad specificity phosphatase PhoE
MGRYEGPGYSKFGGEDYVDTSKRIYEFLKKMEATYSGKTILMVSHQAPLTLLEEKIRQVPLLTITKIPDYIQIQRAEVRDLNKMVSAKQLSPV